MDCVIDWLNQVFVFIHSIASFNFSCASSTKEPRLRFCCGGVVRGALVRVLLSTREVCLNVQGLWLRSGAKSDSRRTVTTCDPCLLTRPVSSVEVSWLGEHRQAVSCRFGRRLYFRRLGLPPNLHSAEYLKCRLRVCTVYLCPVLFLTKQWLL